jgi:hypothetical protein
MCGEIFRRVAFAKNERRLPASRFSGRNPNQIGPNSDALSVFARLVNRVVRENDP